MQRKNFAFRFEWMEAIASYDPNIRLEIYEATIMYAQTGELPEMSPQAALGFETYILPDFERRRRAAEYRARAKARRIAREAQNQTSAPETPNKPVMNFRTDEPLHRNHSSRGNKIREFPVR